MNNKIAFKHSLLFGLLMGAMLILASLIFYGKGLSLSYNPNLLLINRGLIFFGLFFGIIKYRNEVCRGQINYGQAFLLGLFISTTAALLYAVFLYVLISFYDIGILTENINFMEKSLAEIGYTDEQLEIFMNLYRQITPGIFSTSQFFSKAFAGLFFSLIVAFFVKKKPKPEIS